MPIDHRCAPFRLNLNLLELPVWDAKPEMDDRKKILNRTNRIGRYYPQRHNCAVQLRLVDPYADQSPSGASLPVARNL